MATNDVYRPNVDYTLADQITSPVSGKTAFIPSYKSVDATGAVVGGASNPAIVKAASYTQLGNFQLSEPAVSTGLPSIPSDATVAIIQNNGTQPCRFRADGATTAPTTTTGQRIAAGGDVTLDIGQAGLLSTRVIREAAGVTLDILYLK